MIRDERVFLLGEDIGKHGGAFGVTRTLFDQFGPERVRNTPISENTIIGAATGAKVLVMLPSVGGEPSVTNYFQLFDHDLSMLVQAFNATK